MPLPPGDLDPQANAAEEDDSGGGTTGGDDGGTTGEAEDLPPATRLKTSIIYRVQPSPFSLDDIAEGDPDPDPNQDTPDDDPLPPPEEPSKSTGIPLGGRLLSITAPNGQSLTFVYDEALEHELEEVRDDFGRKLHYRYAACDVPDTCMSYSVNSRRLQSVTLEAPNLPDRVVSYDYDARGYLETASFGPRTETYGYAFELPNDDSDAAVYNLVSTSIPGPDGTPAVTRYTYFPVAADGTPVEI